MAKPQRFDILRYSPKPASRGKIRRRYAKWREENGVPVRCDNPKCQFHAQPPMWNGSTLPFILDHENGNNLDNRPENLRLLCPNCDAQLPTRGGANRGRVLEATEGAFTLMSKGGARHYYVFPQSGGIRLSGSASVVFVSGTKK